MSSDKLSDLFNPMHTSTVEEAFRLIVSAPEKLKGVLLERMGESFPDVGFSLRDLAESEVPGFAEEKSRVFLPMQQVFSALMAKAPDEAAREEIFRTRRLWLLIELMTAWSVDRTALTFSRRIREIVVSDDTWWQGLTTDWLAERFRPWALWISDNDGSPRLDGGCFCGLTMRGDGLALFCQYVRAGELPKPWLYAEYALTPGRRLSEVVRVADEGTVFDALYEPFSARQMERAVCRRNYAKELMPLLALALLEKDAQERLGADCMLFGGDRGGGFLPQFSAELPQREDRIPSRRIKDRMLSEFVNAVFFEEDMRKVMARVRASRS